MRGEDKMPRIYLVFYSRRMLVKHDVTVLDTWYSSFRSVTATRVLSVGTSFSRCEAIQWVQIDCLELKTLALIRSRYTPLSLVLGQ